MTLIPQMNINIPKVPFSLEKIIKGMPNHSYVFSEEGKLLTWNENVKILTGYSEDELNNKFVSEFIYQPDKDRVVEKFMELLAEGDDRERVIEYRLKVKSGKVIPVIAMRSLLVVDGNKYMVGILIDISKIKNNKEKLHAQIAEINHAKNQLQDHYRKIEQLNQAEIELKEKLFINAKDFSNKLINSLPGIFYVYEKVGEKFFLKRWNDRLVTDLGYSAEELKNMQPYQFFNKKVYKEIEKAIVQIFTIGTTQIKAPMVFKNGFEVPYLFEAYRFEDKGNLYFIGVGLDISIQHKLEEKQKQHLKEKRKAKEILDANKRELIATALQVSRTNKTIRYTLDRINELLKKHIKTEISSDLNAIRKDLILQSAGQDNWEIFKIMFTDVHKDFFNKLKTKHPALSKSELKFCAYLRIHLSSSQISSVLNVTNEAIKKSRYRIRKKLNLTPKASLEDYISEF